MQLYRLLALHSLLSDMKTYVNGAPSLPAVGVFLHRGLPFDLADRSGTFNR